MVPIEAQAAPAKTGTERIAKVSERLCLEAPQKSQEDA
jgi:hypothetical protein